MIKIERIQQEIIQVEISGDSDMLKAEFKALLESTSRNKELLTIFDEALTEVMEKKHVL